MTPATASAWVVDRLAQGRRVGSVRRGELGGDERRLRSAGCPDRPGGGRLTLEQQLASVWEGLLADGTAECPVCAGTMEGTGPARCTGCGAELS